MAFVRTRTIGNGTYRYLEERYREGGKVKSRSTYLGRVLAALSPVAPENRGWAYIERLMEKYPEPVAAAPTPTDKTSPDTAPDAAPSSPGEADG